MSRRRRIGLGLAGGLLLAACLYLAAPPRRLDRIDPARRGSLRIEDREGRLLRESPVGGHRARWIALGELPAWVPAAVIAAEDRRFEKHPGVDPPALVRAVGQNLAAGRIVSGGSTISMQLVRLLGEPVPRGGRTWTDKLDEAGQALRLELRLGKRRILEQYLNRTAFGRGAVGIEAASWAWFGHSARQLTPGEAAWLAVLPRGPSSLGRPDRADELERRRQRLLDRLTGRAGGSPVDWTRARARPATVNRGAPPFEAPISPAGCSISSPPNSATGPACSAPRSTWICRASASGRCRADCASSPGGAPARRPWS